jgi:hypothetical protein
MAARRSRTSSPVPAELIAAAESLGLLLRTAPEEVEPGYPDESDRIMRDPAEIARFYASGTPLMRQLLEELSTAPEEPRPFPEVEDALGWPHRRIASVLGGVSRMRHREFGGARPYHFLAPRLTVSRRWEIWMDERQAAALAAARRASGG